MPVVELIMTFLIGGQIAVKSIARDDGTCKQYCSDMKATVRAPIPRLEDQKWTVVEVPRVADHDFGVMG